MEFKLYTITKKGFFSRSYEVNFDNTLVFQIRRSFFFSKCTIYDANGEAGYSAKRIFQPFKLRYNLYFRKQKIGEVHSKSNFKAKLIIQMVDGVNYYIDGKYSRRNYIIFREADQIARVSKKNKLFDSTLGVAMKEGEDDELLLIFVMIVEMIIHQKRAKRS